MGTMGVRAVLAGAFLATAGALGGVQAWPGPEPGDLAPTMAVPNLHSPGAVQSPGWFAGLLARSCQQSVAAGRRDEAGARERKQQCDRNHAGSSLGRE